MYNQSFIRVQNTNNGTEMQPVVVKQEPVHEVVTRTTTTAKRTKRKRKISKAKAAKSSLAKSKDLPTTAPHEDDEGEEWETVGDKRKKKVVRAPVRRSSRPKKVIKWDPIYDA